MTPRCAPSDGHVASESTRRGPDPASRQLGAARGSYATIRLQPLLEELTFALAPIGYAGLALCAALAVHRSTPLALWRLVATVIVAHVLLVWHVRYGWQFSEATRNGYGGFLLFHSALLAIVVSTFVSEALRRRLVVAAFLVVTLGASAAVYRYDVVAMYRYPVHIISLLGVGALALRLRRPQPTA